jgi:hypothetical protein
MTTGEETGVDNATETEEGTTVLTEPELTDEQKAEAAKAAEENADAEEGDGADHNTDEKSEDGDADKDKDGAPEEYSEFTLPEGMELDAELLAEATPLLKELGATQEQAQKLVDLQAKSVTDFVEAQSKAWADRLSEWKEVRENDAEYGKGKYDESLAIARSAMREVGGPELAKALEETGVGNHPEFIRFFYRVGKAIGEDGIEIGGEKGH